MLLAQALAGVTPRDQDGQLVLPLLGIQADIFGLLLRGTATAADSTAVLLCLRSKKNKQTNCIHSAIPAAKGKHRPLNRLGRLRQGLFCLTGMKLGPDPRFNGKTSLGCQKRSKESKQSKDIRILQIHLMFAASAS